MNILPTVEKDPRSSDKLIDGVNDTSKPQHMWLTPALPNSYARVFVIFDTPTFVSRIKLYNYRKTPERGVRHVAVSAPSQPRQGADLRRRPDHLQRRGADEHGRRDRHPRRVPARAGGVTGHDLPPPANTREVTLLPRIQVHSLAPFPVSKPCPMLRENGQFSPLPYQPRTDPTAGTIVSVSSRRVDEHLLS